MAKAERTFVIIDGSNFYHRLRDILVGAYEDLFTNSDVRRLFTKEEIKQFLP